MAKRPIVALAFLDEEFASELSDYLERRGNEVLLAAEDWEFRSIVDMQRADVVVIGPTFEPAGVNDALRRQQVEGRPAMILLRANPDLVETVLALEMGAADVVDAPFNIRELAARIGRLVSRLGKTGPELVTLENATVDVRSALVMHRNGGEEQLSPGQVALLKLFLANPRKVLSRDEIMASAPAENYDAFDRSIDSRIVRLRRKLDTECIVTIRGSGYRFDPPGHWPG